MKKVFFFCFFIIIQGCGFDGTGIFSSKAGFLGLSDLELYVSIKEDKRGGTAHVDAALRTWRGIPIKFDQGESLKVTIVNSDGETETTDLTYNERGIAFWNEGTFYTNAFYQATVGLPEAGSDYVITYTDPAGVETRTSFSSHGGPDILSPEDGSTYFINQSLDLTWESGDFDHLKLTQYGGELLNGEFELENTGRYSADPLGSLKNKLRLPTSRIALSNFTTYTEASGFGRADITIETRDEIRLRATW